ncbi:hypothetical protein AAMO2058_001233900 [Amorphochlora amoebiformis]
MQTPSEEKSRYNDFLAARAAVLLTTRTGLTAKDCKSKWETRYLTFSKPEREDPSSLLNGARKMPVETGDKIPLPKGNKIINRFVNISARAIDHDVVPTSLIAPHDGHIGARVAIQDHATQLQSVSQRMHEIKEAKLKMFQQRTRQRIQLRLEQKEEADRKKVSELQGKLGAMVEGCRLYTGGAAQSRTSALALHIKKVQSKVNSAYALIAEDGQGIRRSTSRLRLNARRPTTQLPFWDRGVTQSSRLTKNEEAELMFELKRLEMADERRAAREKMKRADTFVKTVKNQGNIKTLPHGVPMPFRAYEEIKGGDLMQKNELEKNLALREERQKRANTLRRQQRQAASKRYYAAIRRELKNAMQRRKITPPKPCSCSGVNYFNSASQKLHKNNCAFYQNSKRYYAACMEMIKGLNLDNHIVKALESLESKEHQGDRD